MSVKFEWIYGGTFDPVHLGHRACVEAALGLIPEAALRLVPCGDPPHRDPAQAEGRWRAEMLRRAFADLPNVRVDERELQRSGPSYTHDTLMSMQEEDAQPTRRTLILGVDAANGLAEWFRVSRLPQLAHLLIVDRPGSALRCDLVSLGWAAASGPDELQGSTPCHWRIEQPLSAVSSTAVRRAVASGECAPGVIHPEVARIIVRERLYAAGA